MNILVAYTVEIQWPIGRNDTVDTETHTERVDQGVQKVGRVMVRILQFI